VWVRAVVTSKKDDRVGIGVRLASRLGSTYPGSSPKFTRVIDGVVRRIAEVPLEDIGKAGEPLCPVCLREGKTTVGMYKDKSPGGTETWTCGHTIGK
jgi:hypothetical protein